MTVARVAFLFVQLIAGHDGSASRRSQSRIRTRQFTAENAGLLQRQQGPRSGQSACVGILGTSSDKCNCLRETAHFSNFGTYALNSPEYAY